MKKLIIVVFVLMAASANAQLIVNHNAALEFNDIPLNKFSDAAREFNIFYGHTSHGNQIMTGMQMLVEEYGAALAPPSVDEISDDLGGYGDTSWVQPTRDWLDAHPETNMVMWSWCGGASSNSVEGINAYLEAMDQLEADYPDVIFTYMTGHLQEGGLAENLLERNQQIRDFCISNGKLLYDFADIESWDPDGNEYPDGTDACEWCYDWCAVNDCPDCNDCAHSHCFNCYRKAKAFWWMLHELANPGVAPVGDPLPQVTFDLSQNYPNPFNPMTEILVEVHEAGIGEIAIYDVGGNKIRTLFEGYFATGSRNFSWDGMSSSGHRVGSGVYFCRLQMGKEFVERKMTLLK